MEEIIEVNFVYSYSAIKIKEFLGRIPRNIDYINYIDIVNKLTKNDYYQCEPTTEIVSSHIIKQLHTVFKNESISSVYYVLGTLEKSVVDNIKDTISSLTQKKLIINIYHNIGSNINNYSFMFDNIIEFE